MKELVNKINRLGKLSRRYNAVANPNFLKTLTATGEYDKLHEYLTKNRSKIKVRDIMRLIMGIINKSYDSRMILNRFGKYFFVENEELRREIGLRGYETTKKMTWRRNAELNIEIYRKVLKNG